MEAHTKPDLMSARVVRDFALAQGIRSARQLAEAAGVSISVAHGVLSKPEKAYTQPILRKLTDWALSHPVHDRDSDNGPTPVAAPHGPALAARHPGDADLTIDTNDGDAIAEESA